MKSSLSLLFFSLIICLSISCGSTKSGKGYKYAADDIIEMSKGPCFGTCPVYDFRIDGLGNATFSGTTFVTKEGDHTKRFSAEETNALFDTFKTADFWSLENEYTAPVTDLPTTWLSFYFMDRNKKIRCYYGMPVRLINLIEAVEALALTQEGWTGDSISDQ
jgi:hypothetical protein